MVEVYSRNGVCVCVRACMRAFVRACVRACMHVCEGERVCVRERKREINYNTINHSTDEDDGGLQSQRCMCVYVCVCV